MLIVKQLWEPKEYIQFNSRRHYIGEVCGGEDTFIPYRRKYNTLSQEQLQALIQDAKRYHWQALDLARCGLETLPDELWELTELKILSLGNMRLFSAAESELQQSSTKNKIYMIPREIERLQNLQVLSLNGLSLKIQTDTPLRLKRLLYLSIFGCGFTQLPTMFHIPSLEGIIFNCESQSLQESFTSLVNLREIYLTCSTVTTLPEGIGRLPHLEKLDLRHTKITSLPESLREAVHLESLCIYLTPLAEKIPPEILRQSAREVIRYVLSQQSDAPKLYFNESKMVIVGQGHVGKSCVLNRLINNIYTEHPSTEGIDILSWDFEQRGQRYKLNVWDFGGQEIYHSTHQFFLTERSLYLFVWDALAEEEYGRIDYWLKTIQSFAADSPIIIVVNKCDRDIGRIRRIDEQSYRERFPQIQAVIYVSCKDNIEIGNLSEIIQSLAIKLPLMKTSWLCSWMSVREKLEQEAKIRDVIQYNEYLTICASENIGPDEALSLIKYLHDLGIVLHYHQDPLLKNIVILSSRWGTNAVYKVLDEQERSLKGRNGLLYIEDLPNIWSDMERYPEILYPYLLNLMERFQLAFRIDSKTYLVAELLENKPIDLHWDFPFRETLSFHYEYDFLPAGVMTRFIVAINRYLETINNTKQCWHKGAYLRYQSAYALVRLYDNISERYVQIKVSGTSPRDRRELLTKIRTVFEEINSQFKQIKITERIPCICGENCESLFDYKSLLRAEMSGITTIQCHRSFSNIPISKLLDGVDLSMNSESGKNWPIIINNSPQFNNTVSPIVTSTATNSVSVMTKVHNCVIELQGDLNDLKEEVGDQSEEFCKECEKVQAAMEKLEKSQTEEEVKKTGALTRICRFLTECNNPESQIGKVLSGVKHAVEIVQSLTGKYNKLAKWLSLPQLPFGVNN